MPTKPQQSSSETPAENPSIPWQQAFIPGEVSGRPTGDLSSNFVAKLDAPMKRAFEYPDFENYQVRKYFSAAFETALASALIERAATKNGVLTVKSAVSRTAESAITGDAKKQFVINLMTNSGNQTASQSGDMVVQVLLGDSPSLNAGEDGAVLERVDGVVTTRMMNNGFVRVHGIIQSLDESKGKKDGDEVDSILFRINSRGMDILTPLGPCMEYGVLENSKYVGMRLYVKTRYSSYWVDGLATDEMIPNTVSIVAFSPDKENKVGLIHHGRRIDHLLFHPTPGRLGLGAELPIGEPHEFGNAENQQDRFIHEVRILDAFDLEQDQLMQDGFDRAVLATARILAVLREKNPQETHLRSKVKRNMTIIVPSLKLGTLRNGLPRLLHRIMNKTHLGEAFVLEDFEALRLKELVMLLVPQIDIWDQGDSYVHIQ